MFLIYLNLDVSRHCSVKYLFIERDIVLLNITGDGAHRHLSGSASVARWKMTVGGGLHAEYVMVFSFSFLSIEFWCSSSK
jgi:hypothetical protein